MPRNVSHSRTGSGPLSHLDKVVFPPADLDTALITNVGNILAGSSNWNPSYIACTMNWDAYYPDPYLEVAFYYAYHVGMGQEDHLFHRGFVKFTHREVANLRMIRLESPNNENNELQKMTFAESIVHQNRAIAPPHLIADDRARRQAMHAGELYVLRIKLKEGTILNPIDMHPSLNMGEQEGAWSNIVEHLKISRSFNIAIIMREKNLTSVSSLMTQVWQERDNDSRISPLRQFNKYEFGKESNVIVFDVPNSVQRSAYKRQTYSVRATQSVYNEENIQAVQGLVSKLLSQRHAQLPSPFPFKPYDICISTFSPAQQALHRRSMNELHGKRPEMGADQVVIAYADYRVGLESDITILDLITSASERDGEQKSGLFISTHIKRLHSALTRANRGLYVICNMESTYASFKRSKKKYCNLKAVFDNWSTNDLFCESQYFLGHVGASADRGTTSGSGVERGGHVRRRSDLDP